MKEHLIEFNQLAMANSEGSDNMLNRVMPKDNIGLAALLKTKEAAWENGKCGKRMKIFLFIAVMITWFRVRSKNIFGIILDL